MSGRRRKVIGRVGPVPFSLGAWQALLKDALLAGAIPAQAGYTAFLLETYVDYGTGENARPAVETLARLQGVSEKTVRGSLKALLSEGLIEKTRNHTRLRPSTYRMSMKRQFLDENMAYVPLDGSQVVSQDEHQTTPQSERQGYPTLSTLNTSITSLTSNTYAIIKDDGSTYDEEIDNLVSNLAQACLEEYVNLPYAKDADCDIQAEKTMNDVLVALLDNKIDRPIPYLSAILRKEGTYKYGLAVKEMWHQYVGKERSFLPIGAPNNCVAPNE